MSALTKKHPIRKEGHFIHVFFNDKHYCFPEQVANRYCLENKGLSDSFERLNQQYSKPGALLKGVRIRENLTQEAMAQKFGITQSDISQMENGKRAIGKTMAKRIQKAFVTDYHLFLA